MKWNLRSIWKGFVITQDVLESTRSIINSINKTFSLFLLGKKKKIDKVSEKYGVSHGIREVPAIFQSFMSNKTAFKLSFGALGLSLVFLLLVSGYSRQLLLTRRGLGPWFGPLSVGPVSDNVFGCLPPVPSSAAYAELEPLPCRCLLRLTCLLDTRHWLPAGRRHAQLSRAQGWRLQAIGNLCFPFSLTQLLISMHAQTTGALH